MKKILVFLIAFLVYFYIGTRGSFIVPLDLDHFNPLAKSLLRGRLDIPEPAATYDLAFYQGRWYPYWGVLPALILIPWQFLMGRYLPLLYLNVFFGSLNAVVIYLLLKRLKQEFLSRLSELGVFLITALFAFGTTHFYLAANAGVWHTAQVVSFFPTTLGIYLIFKKKRSFRNYFFSSLLISLAFLGRGPMIFILLVPGFLALAEPAAKKKKALRLIAWPIIFFASIFLIYNWLRFDNPLENGYRHVIYHPYFQPWIDQHGIYSLAYLLKNLWIMLLEIPALSWQNGLQFRFNLDGNSMFFLTPPLLAVFLASWRGIYQRSLWLALIAVIFPILLIYSSGWLQFGYRYSLDFMAPLLLLAVFGIKGRVNFLFFLGTVFAVWIHYLGIIALQ